jgi:two-component system, chemotaxis family, sensor kinase Cph1
MIQTPPGELKKGPIHRPNCIQPHGVMIVLRSPSLTIAQVSENIATVFGMSHDDVLDKPIDTLLEAKHVAHIRHMVDHNLLTNHPFLLFTASVRCILSPAPLFEAIIHRHDSVIFLEFEPVQLSHEYEERDPFCILQEGLVRLHGATNLAAFYQITADYVQKISGFDRVIVYRFTGDESGLVVGEARNEHIPSLMGLRFPALDIPKPARALALHNRLRLIPNLFYHPSPIHPTTNPATGKPLDMSFAVLRNAHPSHIDYLSRMGLRASMAISLVKDNALWGFVVCNHSSGTQHISFNRRAACEMLALMFVSLLPTQEEEDVHEAKSRFMSHLTPLLARLSKSHDLVETLMQAKPNVAELLCASGAAICLETSCHCVGTTPAPEEIIQLVAWIATHHPDDIFVTDALSILYPAGESLKETASGVLALPLSGTQPAYVLWFRPENVKEISWCGDPNQPFVVSNDGKKVVSHKSFEIHTQTVYGTSLPWEGYRIAAARDMWVSLLLARTNSLLNEGKKNS